MEALVGVSRSNGWRTVSSEAQSPPISTLLPAPPEKPASVLIEPRAVVERYKQAIQKQLVTMIDGGRLRDLPLDRQRSELRTLLSKQFANDPPPVPASEYNRLLQELLDEILGFGPLEPLLLDPTISDILVNGAHEVYVERRGVLELTDVHFRDDDQVLQVIHRIVDKVNRRIDESSPMVDARLPDGSRVNAILLPQSLRGPSLSIRRFGGKARTRDDLTKLHMLTPEMSVFLKAAVKSRFNIIISGGTGFAFGVTKLALLCSLAVPCTVES